MTHFAFAIHPETNDLFLGPDNNIAVVRGSEAVGQHARQRLMMFEGEWFLDITAGVPWLAQIMGGAYDPALAEAVTKAQILDTDGVVEITSFSVGFNRATRDLQIREVEVRTVYDEEVQV